MFGPSVWTQSSGVSVGDPSSSAGIQARMAYQGGSMGSKVSMSKGGSGGGGTMDFCDITRFFVIAATTYTGNPSTGRSTASNSANSHSFAPNMGKVGWGAAHDRPLAGKAERPPRAVAPAFYAKHYVNALPPWPPIRGL